MKKIVSLLATLFIMFANLNAQVLNPGVSKIIPTTAPVIPGVNSPAIKNIKYSVWKSFIDLGMRGAFLHFNNYDAAGVNTGDGFQYFKKMMLDYAYLQ